MLGFAASQDMRTGDAKLKRRKAPKNLNLLRAAYRTNARSLQQYLTAACDVVPDLSAREVAHPTMGTLRINHHQVDRNGLSIHLVAKYSGEAAATVADTRGIRADDDVHVPPPERRAFKSADLFALIRGNNVVVCTDGIRHQALEYYLKNFLQVGRQSNASVMFTLERVANTAAVATLTRGGVKEIKLTGTLFNATVDLLSQQAPPGGSRTLNEAVANLKAHLAAVFGKDEDEEFAEHSDELQVEVVVKARGGIRADGSVLSKLEEVGIDLLDELDQDVGYVIKTNDNKIVRGKDLVIIHPVQLERTEGGNSLVRHEVYDKLAEALATFTREGDLEL